MSQVLKELVHKNTIAFLVFVGEIEVTLCSWC